MDARQIIDLKIGCAFSRFQTIYLSKKYPDLAQKKITFGPCQTPTLGFCVQRHDERIGFKPKPQYFLQLIFKVKDREVVTKYQQGAIANELEVNKISDTIYHAKDVEVLEFIEKSSSRSKPEGLNTVQLLKVTLPPARQPLQRWCDPGGRHNSHRSRPACGALTTETIHSASRPPTRFAAPPRAVH